MTADDKTLFSVTNFGDFQSDQREGTVTLGSFYPPILERTNVKGIDLNEGLECFKDEYGTEIDQLHNLLTFIEQSAKPGQTLREVVQSAEFVCCRGLLKHMLETRSTDSLTVLAARFNGTIFMCVAEEENERNKIRGIYYASKFQKIMTDRFFFTKPVTNQKTSKTVLRGVFENSNGKHTVLYSGQIDGIDSNNQKVVLRTSSGTLDDYWLENRSMNWFMQAYLTNVDTIIVGERYYGKMKRTYPLKISEIPSMVNGNWSKADCLDSLHTTLSKLKECLPIDGSAKKIKFKDGDISCTDVEMSSILTESFMQRFGPQL